MQELQESADHVLLRSVRRPGARLFVAAHQVLEALGASKQVLPATVDHHDRRPGEREGGLERDEVVAPASMMARVSPGRSGGSETAQRRTSPGSRWLGQHHQLAAGLGHPAGVEDVVVLRPHGLGQVDAGVEDGEGDGAGAVLG